MKKGGRSESNLFVIWRVGSGIGKGIACDGREASYTTHRSSALGFIDPLVYAFLE